MGLFISEHDPVAVQVVQAIQSGEVPALVQLLAEHPHLSQSMISKDLPKDEVQARSLLHIVADWPGHIPQAAELASVLVQAGADVNARFVGAHRETPLHWAASNDDVILLDVLLDAGAHIEADGGVIANGTPLDDAVAFGQWKAAQRLVERGAVTKLWHEAALGMLDSLQLRFEHEDSQPQPQEITAGLWHACHGGQRAAAEFLWNQGANHEWVGYDGKTPCDIAKEHQWLELVAWLKSLPPSQNVTD